jgi:hypothetical protein
MMAINEKDQIIIRLEWPLFHKTTYLVFVQQVDVFLEDRRDDVVFGDSLHECCVAPVVGRVDVELLTFQQDVDGRVGGGRLGGHFHGDVQGRVTVLEGINMVVPSTENKCLKVGPQCIGCEVQCRVAVLEGHGWKLMVVPST